MLLLSSKNSCNHHWNPFSGPSNISFIFEQSQFTSALRKQQGQINDDTIKATIMEGLKPNKKFWSFFYANNLTLNRVGKKEQFKKRYSSTSLSTFKFEGFIVQYCKWRKRGKVKETKKHLTDVDTRLFTEQKKWLNNSYKYPYSEKCVPT